MEYNFIVIHTSTRHAVVNQTWEQLVVVLIIYTVNKEQQLKYHDVMMDNQVDLDTRDQMGHSAHTTGLSIE